MGFNPSFLYGLTQAWSPKAQSRIHGFRGRSKQLSTHDDLTCQNRSSQPSEESNRVLRQLGSPDHAVNRLRYLFNHAGCKPCDSRAQLSQIPCSSQQETLQSLYTLPLTGKRNFAPKIEIMPPLFTYFKTIGIELSQ